MTKTLIYKQQIEQPIDNTKRHQSFDYTTIADRLRTVSWSIGRL